MKKIFIVYRSNDLFYTLVPALIAFMPSGFDAVLVAFEQGTGMDEITAKVTELLKSITSDSLYFSDNTCSLGNLKGIDEAIKKAAFQAGLYTLDETLDHLAEMEVGRTLKSKSYEEALKKIAPFVAEKPNEIVIVEQCLADHIYDKQVHADHKNLITKFLAEAYPAASITTVLTTAEAIAKFGQKEDALIVADRHTSILSDSWEISDWKEKAKLLVLPFENTLRHIGATRQEFSEGLNPKRMIEEIAYAFE
jgi:hypothetical protein